MLPCLQEILDKNSQNGMFILTASHKSEETTAQIAGKVAALELYPFSLEKTLNIPHISRNVWELILNGFYPRLLAKQIRPESYYRSYIATYVEWDLQSSVQIKEKHKFEKFLTLLASEVGQLLDYNSFSTKVKVLPETIKSWINVLKSLYMIYELPAWSGNIRKKLVKSPKLYFTDTGLAAYLMGIRDRQTLESHPLRDLLFENFVLMDLVKRESNRGRKPSLSFFKDFIGNKIDILWEQNGFYMPIEIRSADTFDEDFVKGIFILKRILRKTEYGKQLLPGMVICNTEQTFYFNGVKICNLLLNEGKWE
jgi:predicted AAA+ superfamily ATPase